MARLLEGRANTARGDAHFLREMLGRVRYAGARDQLTVRADSGFYTHSIVALCRRMKVRFSISVRRHARLRQFIKAIPEAEWRPIPYWMEDAADVAEAEYTPFRSERDAAPVRLNRSQGQAHARLPTRSVRQLQLSLLHHRPRRGCPGAGGRPPPPRRDRECHPGPEVRRGDSSISPRDASPQILSLPKGAWLAVQDMAHSLARWTTRIGLGEPVATTKTLRRRCFSLVGRLTRSARRLTLHLPRGWPWESQFSGALARLRALPIPS